MKVCQRRPHSLSSSRLEQLLVESSEGSGSRVRGSRVRESRVKRLRVEVKGKVQGSGVKGQGEQQSPEGSRA